MANRSNRQQSTHNKGVKSTAKYYESKGYKVEADIAGFKTPKTLYGRRPDVIASNKKETVVVEVETPDTLAQDKRQQEVFKNYAAKHKDVRFWRKTTK